MKDEKKSREEKGKQIMAFLGFVLVLLLFCGFLLNISIERALYNRFEDRGLPRINIDLNGVSLEEIKSGSKDIKYKDNDLQVYNDGKIINYGGVEIKGRGNLSWDQPKKSYQLEFPNSTSLLNKTKAKRWVIIANFLDKSFIRNDSAFLMAEMLEMRFNQRGEFVEVYFNGEYEGLYYLMKKINIAKNSVNLRKEGIILIEIDNLHNNGECFISYFGNCLVIKDVIGDEIKSMESFLRDYNKLEKSAEKGDFETISDIVDIKSFVDYFLLNEFVMDPDAYSSSFYLYREGLNGKIHAGPVWDFDLAYGNKAWNWIDVDESFYFPTGNIIRKKEAFGEGGFDENKEISKLLYYLIDNNDFRELVVNEYKNMLAKRVDEYMIMISNTIKRIRESAEMDDVKWGESTFQLQTNLLMEWIRKRFEFFEQEYNLDYDEQMEVF